MQRSPQQVQDLMYFRPYGPWNADLPSPNHLQSYKMASMQQFKDPHNMMNTQKMGAMPGMPGSLSSAPGVPGVNPGQPPPPQQQQGGPGQQPKPVGSGMMPPPSPITQNGMKSGVKSNVEDGSPRVNNPNAPPGPVSQPATPAQGVPSPVHGGQAPASRLADYNLKHPLEVE